MQVRVAAHEQLRPAKYGGGLRQRQLSSQRNQTPTQARPPLNLVRHGAVALAADQDNPEAGRSRAAPPRQACKT